LDKSKGVNAIAYTSISGSSRAKIFCLKITKTLIPKKLASPFNSLKRHSRRLEEY
jgi:hypothetical protein